NFGVNHWNSSWASARKSVTSSEVRRIVRESGSESQTKNSVHALAGRRALQEFLERVLSLRLLDPDPAACCRGHPEFDGPHPHLLQRFLPDRERGILPLPESAGRGLFDQDALLADQLLGPLPPRARHAIG